MTEVEEQGQRLARARIAEGEAKQDLRAAVRSAAEQGTPETELARQAGVDRMTIRRMLGKGR